jgi:hypothetical protein
MHAIHSDRHKLRFVRGAATESGPPSTATIDVDAPGQGIACGHDQLLGLDLRSACTASEHWLRGGDIIAVYEPDDPRRLRATALWRSRAMPGLAVWELIASATTSRTQSDASLAVVSDVAAAAIMWGRMVDSHLQWTDTEPAAADCVVVRRPEARDGSVLLAVHPADSRGLFVHRQDARARIACWLFSAAAEKGVLFRGRTLAAVGPAADDTAWATKLWAAFLAAPPMLTT